jgi:hypothetical protein
VSILIASLEFALDALIGAGFGMLMVVIFCHPERPGPTARTFHLMYTAMLVGVCGELWAGAFGFKADMRGQPWEVTYGLATGFTIGSSWLWMRRQPRYRRYLRSRTARPPRRLVVLFADYLLGVTFCIAALAGGTVVSRDLHASVAQWFSGTAHLPALIGTHIVLGLAGLAWSQVITAAMLRAMRGALAHDSQITRRWKFILLAVPFALYLPVSIVAPGILAGILLNLVTLWAGWRYTPDPPDTPLRTWKTLRAQRSASVGAELREKAGSGLK